MTRFEATACLASTLTDEPVAVSLGHPAYDLFAAGDRALNFYTWGSMGLTTSVALGLALVRPDRRVIAIDGDGSLLMNLGSLATIAACAPPNLLVVVMDNGEYATTGGQPTFTSQATDLEAVARAAGIAESRTVSGEPELRRALDDSRAKAGPWLVVAKVRESAPADKPPLDCVFIKNRFMAALDAERA